MAARPSGVTLHIPALPWCNGTMDAVPEEIKELLRRLGARIGQQHPDEIRSLVCGLAVCAIAAEVVDFAVSHSS